MGSVRTFATDRHTPSPLMAGEMTASTSSGRAGSVVVVVVVVVVSPGSVLLVVVVVEEVVVEVVVVASGAMVVVTTLLGAGHDCVAFIGRRTAGAVLPVDVVVVEEGVVLPFVARVVSTCGGSVSNGTRARVSTGATAGGSLWSHVSILSTMAPMPLLRAQEAMFCCNGSFGCARTYRVTENPLTSENKRIPPLTVLRILRRFTYVD